MIDRAELDRWLREHDYALVTREQAARLEGASGVVPWDEHRRALAKADADLDAARARVAAVRKLHHEVDEHGDGSDTWCAVCLSGEWPCETIRALDLAQNRAVEEDAHLRAEIGRLTSAIMARARREAELETELDAARAESARLRAHLAAARRRKEADRARLAALEAENELLREIEQRAIRGVEFGEPVTARMARAILTGKDDR